MDHRAGTPRAVAGTGVLDLLAPADAAQLRGLVTAIGEVLGDGVLGIYVTGSATDGGLRPDSDLDLVVVTGSALGERARPLAAATAARSGGRNGLRPVELLVLALDQVRPWRFPPPRELHYGEWLRPEFEAWLADHRWPDPWGASHDPDVAVLVTQSRRTAWALTGPALAELLDPVPAADLRAAVVHGVPGLLADLASDTRNVLLTLARIVTTLRTGLIEAKDVAADAVLRSEHLPDHLRVLLRLARDAYLGLARDDWTAHLPDAKDLAQDLTDIIRSEVRAEPASGGIPGAAGRTAER